MPDNRETGDGTDPSDILHASCVAYQGRAVLILGRSGQGKSGLAMQLMAYGADLVADDRTQVTVQDERLWATAAPELAGWIEARGVGLLRASITDTAEVVLVVDLDTDETDRLPLAHTVSVSGITLPKLHKVDSPYFPAAVLQYLKAGRKEPS